MIFHVAYRLKCRPTSIHIFFFYQLFPE